MFRDGFAGQVIKPWSMGKRLRQLASSEESFVESLQTRVKRNRQIHQTRKPATTATTANGDIASETTKMRSDWGKKDPNIIIHNPSAKVTAATMPPKQSDMILFRDIFNVLSSNLKNIVANAGVKK